MNSSRTFLLFAATVALGPRGALAAEAPSQADFYVAPGGDDRWSGRRAEADRERRDGPFRSLDRAREAVREERRREPERKKPVVVLVRGGIHFLERTLVFTPEDSGTPESPVLYAAYPGETPVLSGGVRVTGWREVEKGRWVTEAPAVGDGRLRFRQLFMNGRRSPRPALPKEGYFTIDEELEPGAGSRGYDRFQFKPGDLRTWQNLEAVEALCYHAWSMSRLRIRELNEEGRRVVFTGSTWARRGYSRLGKGDRYRVENVSEALARLGEWYLDPRGGRLTYLARPGEEPDAAEAIAPRLTQLVSLAGEPERERYVERLRFRGLTFAHTAWELPEEGYSCPQAEVFLGAAFSAQGARSCRVEACTFAHTGAYALEFGHGSKQNEILENHLHDLGGGGIKIGEPAQRDAETQVASHNLVEKNHIHDVGLVHPAAVGVWIGQSHSNRVLRNEIHHLFYTGISVGWTWGYGPTKARENLIQENHIHHIGQGVLSDMGGIYTLGVQPGTRLWQNHIHDVESYGYGGWGIYLDEGSSDILVENNLVYRTKTGGFHQHYGRENTIENNIFALAREGQVQRTRQEPHRSFTFRRNIVYWDSGEPLTGDWKDARVKMESNVYWRTDGKPISFAGLSFDEWRRGGYDQDSLIADPLFRAPVENGFRLLPGSPALQVGFRPFKVVTAGSPAEPPGETPR